MKHLSVEKPNWLRVKAPQKERIGDLSALLSDLGLNSVCQEASCPNIGECFSSGTATFLIMGPGCTRACPYCDISFDRSKRELDPTEPDRLAEAVVRMKLKHVVITSVNRDDLEDGGASQFIECINAIRQRSSNTSIEVLIPDLCGNWEALKEILKYNPDVLNHNIETVPRLYRRVRPQGNYQRSLELLRKSREICPKIYTKSGLMVGLGEFDFEVMDVQYDLRANNVDIMTIGQYLSPGPNHLAVARFVSPIQFKSYQLFGENELNFLQVVSSPLTRSSYHAEEIQKIMHKYPR
tara:strand:+ start:7063 stop:7947 length:885 start_codon:yes stop_codon:yes gene_type:complete